MLNMATMIFCVAAATDYADGFIARRWGAVSDFGKLLDPLADKILVMAALVMLVGVRDDLVLSSSGRMISEATGQSLVPAGMVVLVLAREFWITGLRALAAAQGTIVAAKSAGKVKSALQMVAIVCVLLFDHQLSLGGYRITAQLVGLLLLSISILFSYLSAYEYTVAIFFPTQGESGGNVVKVLKGALIGAKESQGTGEPE